MDYDPKYVAGESEDEDLYSATPGGAAVTSKGDPEKQLNLAAAKWPQYAKESRRRETFRAWTKPKIDVEALIIAGMFYKGEEDKTECFYCGVPLKLWEIHDEPWIEHARFSQNCLFLHRCKGLAFVIAALEFYELPTTGIELRRRAENPPLGATETAVPSPQDSGSSQSSQRPATRRIRRRVEPREIRSRLDLGRVKMLVALGYPRELVGQIIGERLQTEADDFKYFGDLVRAVMNGAELLGIELHTDRPRVTLATQSFPPNVSQSYPHTALPRALERSTFSGASASHLPFASLPVTSPREAPDKTITSAMEENRSLKQKLYCKKCWKKEVNVVLLNCGHMVLCEDCAKLVHICPKCHNHILQRVKVFVS
jgi:hypothetical protein